MLMPVLENNTLWPTVRVRLAVLVQVEVDVDATELANPFEEALASGNYGLALGLIFLGGIATSLTPCVYPMIAITVSIFGARQTKNKVEGAMLSGAFVLGIAALFTPLGLFAALTGGIFGSALASPVVLVGLAVLFLALAASMFGAFDLDLPPVLKNRLATMGGVGYKGAFALGLASALIAAPCTGPVLGFLLTWVGTSGNVAFGALSLFSYALGLGLLFFLVGTFSVSLPKSGQWLEWIKSVFGIVMVVAAIYYVRDLIPGLAEVASKNGVFLSTSAAMLVAGLAVGAIHLSFHSHEVTVKLRKGLGIALAVLGLSGLVGYADAIPEGAHITWSETIADVHAHAQAAGKPLLIDFGASWCGACGELERHTFTDPRIIRESQRFHRVRVDLSPGQKTEEKEALLGTYAQRGLPLVVLHHSDGSESGRVTSFIEPDQFLAMMKDAK